MSDFPTEMSRYYGDRQLRSLVVQHGGSGLVTRSDVPQPLRHHANMAYSIYRRLELIPSLNKKKPKIQEGGTNEERFLTDNLVLVGEEHQIEVPKKLESKELAKEMKNLEGKMSNLILFNPLQVHSLLLCPRSIYSGENEWCFGFYLVFSCVSVSK